MASWVRAILLALVAGAVGGALWLIAPDNEALTENESMAGTEHTLTLTSTTFNDGGVIPARYTCDAENVSPPLAISGVPADAAALVLIMDDPDIPEIFKEQQGINAFVHWVAFNIPSSTTEIAEGEAVGTQGANGAGNSSYTGPCPPTEYEPTEHRYFFKLYALDTPLDLPVGATKEDVEAAMNGHIITQTELVGRYDRATSSESN